MNAAQIEKARRAVVRHSIKTDRILHNLEHFNCTDLMNFFPGTNVSIFDYYMELYMDYFENDDIFDNIGIYLIKIPEFEKKCPGRVPIDIFLYYLENLCIFWNSFLDKNSIEQKISDLMVVFRHYNIPQDIRQNFHQIFQNIYDKQNMNRTILMSRLPYDIRNTISNYLGPTRR